ncbi:hypothetical protein [Neptuniibacter sp.]|uniref:L,D-transpeptidase Cds6 family protein n=1 Tax=Neptuniibacter sp. TaxID=1962643 RepID=UPI0026093063|nr:hypothetical protein [Neptuniibacter sp.]MCP4598303.1 hypothetical protein [Neptuniibacter sp.]
MSDTSLTSTDMLLSNLADHQVIRIEGSDNWMKQVSDKIISSNQDCIVFEGESSLSGIQERLSSYLQVENGAAFIQQELKSWLGSGRRLLIVLNSPLVGLDALTYLMGLPSICDESGSAVTVILVTSSELIKTLKSSSALSGKLDGYYQEEKEPVVVAGGGSGKVIAAVLVVACVGTGSWFWFKDGQSDLSPAIVDLQSPQENITSTPSSTVESPVDTSTSIANAESSAQIKAPHEKEKVVIKLVDSDGDGEADLIKKTVVTPAEEKAVSSENQQLLTELSATVENARAELRPHAEKDKQEVLSSDIRQTDVDITSPVPKSTPTIQSTNTVVEAASKKAANNKAEPATAIAKKEKAPIAVTKTKPEAFEPIDQTKNTVTPKKYTTAKAIAAINNEAAVRQVVEQWGKAWGSQDWNGYINSYLQNTKLYGVKISLEEWRAFRKKRLMTPEWIKLELGDVKYTRLNSHWYRAEFYQRFEKPGYADETTKRLELTLTSNGWKIASEAADGTVVLKRPGGV